MNWGVSVKIPMEPEEFLGILLATHSENEEERNAALERQNEFLQQDPLNFILGLVQIAGATTNSSHIKLAITILYSVCIHSSYLVEDEIIGPFFEKICSLSMQLFLAPYVDENTKLLIGTILAEIAIALYAKHPENTQIQEFLLTVVSQNPEYAQWIIHTISEILFSSQDFCNFDLGQLIQLMDVEVTPLLKVKLYFSIASHCANDQEDIHALFDSVLELINGSGEITKCFKIISHFAEQHSRFFYPHIDAFPSYICEHIMEGDNNTKREGIYILQSMAESEQEMCSGNPRFYEPVIDVLIKVMSDITETSNYDPDTNDEEPCAIARMAFGPITKALSNGNAYKYLRDIKENIIDGLADPNLVYGVLIAISEVTLLMLSNYLPRNDDELESTFWYSIISLVCEADIPPRIRYAGYCALKNLARSNCPNFQNKTFEIIIPAAFEQFKESEIKEVSMACLRFIKSFISKWSGDGVIEQFQTIYDEVCELIKAADDEEILALLIKILGAAFKKVLISNRNPLEVIRYDEVLQLLCELLDASEDVNIQSSVVVAFSKLLGGSVVEDNESLAEVIPKFYELSIELVESEDTPPSIVCKISNAQSKIMPYLGEGFAAYADQTMQEGLSVISELPKGEEFPIFEQVVTSGYYCTPNPKPGTKYYVEKTLIDTYKSGLEKIDNAATILKVEFGQYVEEVMRNLFQLIEQEEFIEEIREAAWVCISFVVSSQKKNPEGFFALVQEVVPKFVEHARQPYVPKSFEVLICAMKRIIIASYKIIKSAPDCRESVAPMFVPLLEAIAIIKEKLENDKISMHEDQLAFDQVDLKACGYTKISDTIDYLAELMKKLGKIIPAETAEFFNASLAPGTNEKVHNPILENNELSFIMAFINTAKSEEAYQAYREILLSFLTNTAPLNEKCKSSEEEDGDERDMEVFEFDVDRFFIIIEGLIEFLMKTTISLEAANELFNICNGLFDEQFLLKDVFNTVDDNIKIMITVLINKYSDLDDPSNLFDVFCTCITIQEQNRFNHFIPYTILKYLTNSFDDFFVGGEEDFLPEFLMSFFNFFRSDMVKVKYLKPFTKMFIKASQLHPRILQASNAISSKPDLRAETRHGINNFLIQRGIVINEIKKLQEEQAQQQTPQE